ncbi:MAG: homoserine kinase [Clostridium sp.]|nr:homoserine kinase [Clostridium sp.]
MKDKYFKVRVPATSANIGPGFDSLGIAFELFNEYIFTEIESGVEFIGFNSEFSNKDNIIFKTMEKIFKDYGHNYSGLRIEITNCNIPISRGLGSSSSCIIAGIIGAFSIMGKEFNKSEVLNYAVEIEGHPDNVCPAIYGGMVIAVMEENKPIFNNIYIKDGISFVALIPEFKLSTEEARGILPNQISFKDGIYNVGRTALLLSAFANGNYDLLKYAMKDKLHQKYRSIFIKEYDKIIKESMELGALGYFISGSGPTIMTVIKENDKIFKGSIKKFLKDNNLKYSIVELKIDKTGVTVSDIDKTKK